MAVVMSICGSAPFNGASDQALAVAYIAVFVLVFTVTLFPLGAHHLIAKDFVGPDIEPEEVQEMLKARRRALRNSFLNLFCQHSRGMIDDDEAMRVGAQKMSIPGQADDIEKTDLDEGKEDPGEDSKGDYEENIVQTSVLPTSTYPSTPSISPTVVPNTGLHSTRPQSAGGLTSDENTLPPTSPAFNAGDDPKTMTTRQPLQEAPTLLNSAPLLAPKSAEKVDQPPFPASTQTTAPEAINARQTAPVRSVLAKVWHHIQSFFRSLFTPASISIILSFPIALIPPVKGLFVPLPPTSRFHIPNAPDGQPPLAFIMDTAKFIAGLSVPTGLICLGSALARLRVPRVGLGLGIRSGIGRRIKGGLRRLSALPRRASGRASNLPLTQTQTITSTVVSVPRETAEEPTQDVRSLPVGAIMWLAIGKMLIMPVLGVVFCELVLVKWWGIVDEEDRVLRFVCMFFSCLPTATTQVFLTQVYSGTGNAEHLSSFLIPQYTIMLFSMTALTAYALQLLF
ncbi:hypothetical protein AX16_009484 [Volvariella volvacea WC 439]|nr:hypothetical protein AX16_009484 [Volvariella volvacea WC 439]